MTIQNFTANNNNYCFSVVTFIEIFVDNYLRKEINFQWLIVYIRQVPDVLFSALITDDSSLFRTFSVSNALLQLSSSHFIYLSYF